MTKKVKYTAPTMVETIIQPTVILAGSPTGKIDGTEQVNYDPTPGDPSTGLSRRYRDVWGDDDENEEDF